MDINTNRKKGNKKETNKVKKRIKRQKRREPISFKPNPKYFAGERNKQESKKGNKRAIYSLK